MKIFNRIIVLVTIPGAVQVKWFVRLVLKDMRLGVGQNTILGQIHPDARELYDVNASLKKVCQTLRDPTVRYKLEIPSWLKRFCQYYIFKQYISKITFILLPHASSLLSLYLINYAFAIFIDSVWKCANNFKASAVYI